MKTSISTLVLLFICFFPNIIKAQGDEIHLNFSNLIFSEATGEYNHRLTEDLIISAFGGYHYGLPYSENSGYNRFTHIGPEIKLLIKYPSITNENIFIGLYGRYLNGQAKSGSYDSFETRDYYPVSDYQKISVGISAGVRWALKESFLIGSYVGLERFVYSQYDNPEYFDVGYGGLDSENFGSKVGITIGYRFGAKSSNGSNEN